MVLNQEPAATDTAHRVRVILAGTTSPKVYATARQRFGVQLVNGYASAETNIVLGGPLADQRPDVMGSVRDGYQAMVVDQNDVEVPDGTPGELVLRHRDPFAFATGYHRMPESTVAAWRNLWFHTGDQVVRDVHGRFSFLGRLKDDPPPRRKHLCVGGRRGLARAPSDHSGCRLRCAVRTRRGRGDGSDCAAASDHGRTRRRGAPPRNAVGTVRDPALHRLRGRTAPDRDSKVTLRERGVTEHTWDREREKRQHPKSPKRS